MGIQKRRMKKNQKMKTHFLIIVSLSVFHMGQTMPQNQNNPNNRPGSRENPVGGFRPFNSANNNRNEAGSPRRPSRPSRPASPAQPANPVNPRPPRPLSFSPAFPAPELYTGPKYDQFGSSFTGAEDYLIDDEDDYYDDDYYDDYDIMDYVDIPVRLPNFKNVDILRATEVLRSRDQNKNIFVNPGSVNAGILPLAFENPSNLGLFPPLLNSNP